MANERIKELGANVSKIPNPEEISILVPRIIRMWAELHEADRDLALEQNCQR